MASAVARLPLARPLLQAVLSGARRPFLRGLPKLDLRRTFEQQKVVRFPVSTIYGAVAAVDQYADFLPWCLSSRVIERRKGAMGKAEEQLLITEIEVGIASLSANFGSKVTLLPNERVHAVSEPNQYLDALSFTWNFSPIGEQVCASAVATCPLAVGTPPIATHSDAVLLSGLAAQACRIDLQLDFALRNAEHVMMWDVMQDRVIAEYLNCFQRRCANIEAKKVE
eukprot:scaffold6876_cov35-Tisochrysis_lutea.AAC.3